MSGTGERREPLDARGGVEDATVDGNDEGKSGDDDQHIEAPLKEGPQLEDHHDLDQEDEEEEQRLHDRAR